MPHKKDPNKKKRGILDGYKTYDPGVEGFGNVHQWRNAWESMGHDEAVVTIAKDDPLSVLGFTSMPTKAVLDTTFRKLVMQHHPDRGGDPVMFKKVHAAWTLLTDKLEKRR